MNEEAKQIVEAVKDPLTFHWLTYAWVVILSAWGGTVKFLNNLRGTSRTKREAISEFVIGLITNTFVGVLTFYVCQAMEMDMLWSAVAISVNGYMGVKAIELFHESLQAKFPEIFGRRHSEDFDRD